MKVELGIEFLVHGYLPLYLEDIIPLSSGSYCYIKSAGSPVNLLRVICFDIRFLRFKVGLCI